MNELRNRAWNCRSKTYWNYELYKFGRVRFGKSAAADNDESTDDDESVNDEPVEVDDELVNEPIVDESITKVDMFRRVPDFVLHPSLTTVNHPPSDQSFT